MAIVYKATNTVNGKRYIGASVRPLGLRQYQHFCDAHAGRGQMIFHAAIRKYGEGAFEWEILGTFPTQREALDEEMRLIALLKPEYNLARGGQGVVGVKRTEQWLRRMSESLKGRRFTGERLAAARRAIKLANEARQVSVCCLEDGQRFPNLKAAAAFYGIGQKGISEVLAGRQHRVGGRHFRRSDETPETEREALLGAALAAERQASDRKFSRLRQSRSRGVACITEAQTYPSVKAAAAAYKISASLVMQACKSGKPTSSGMRFSYTQPPKPGRPGGHPGKPVICINDNATFPSAVAAARAYGIDPGSVNAICRRRPKAVSVRGLIFRFVEDIGDQPIDIENVGARRYMRPVVCCNDGKSYPSIGDAAAAYGVSLGAVSNVLRGKAETTAGGRVFRYADDPLAGVLVPAAAHRRHQKRVICETDGKEYVSASAASKAYGVSFQLVSRLALTGASSKFGLRFRYTED